MTKLAPEDLTDIRRRKKNGESQRQIAFSLGVSPQRISQILTKGASHRTAKSWKRHEPKTFSEVRRLWLSGYSFSEIAFALSTRKRQITRNSIASIIRRHKIPLRRELMEHANASTPDHRPGRFAD